MEIKSKGDDRFEIKTKSATITTGEMVKVNEVELAGPGEYEVGDTNVLGFPPSVYLISSEELKLAYLDRISSSLNDEQIEQLSEPDILMIPCGGQGSLPAKDAERMVSLIDPKLVIPMLGDVSAFAKKLATNFETVSSLKVSKSSLPEDGRKVVVFKS